MFRNSGHSQFDQPNKFYFPAAVAAVPWTLLRCCCCHCCAGRRTRRQDLVGMCHISWHCTGCRCGILVQFACHVLPLFYFCAKSGGGSICQLISFHFFLVAVLLQPRFMPTISGAAIFSPFHREQSTAENGNLDSCIVAWR